MIQLSKQLEKIKKHGIGLCGRCRWTTVCLSCDYEKALQYYMKKEFPMDDKVATLIIAESTATFIATNQNTATITDTVRLQMQFLACIV